MEASPKSPMSGRHWALALALPCWLLFSASCAPKAAADPEVPDKAEFAALSALLETEFPREFVSFKAAGETDDLAGSQSLAGFSAYVFNAHAHQLRLAPDDALFDAIRARRDALRLAGPAPPFNCEELGIEGHAALRFEGDWFMRTLKAVREGARRRTAHDLPSKADYEALLAQAKTSEDRRNLQVLVDTPEQARFPDHACGGLSLWLETLSELPPDVASRLYVAEEISGLPLESKTVATGAGGLL